MIYHYSFIHGGLADFLKFFIHSVYLHKIYNIDLFICVEHPIINYIVWNPLFQKKVLSSLPSNSIKLGSRYKNCDFKTILDSVKSDKQLVLSSLDFFSYNIQFNLPYELNFHNRMTYPEFKMSDYFYLQNPYPRYIPQKPFVCIHLRMGDKYSNIIPNVDYCDQDDRFVSKSHLERHLSTIINMIDEYEIYFLSDNINCIEQVVSTYKTIRSIPIKEKTILNISYPIDDAILFHKGLEYTIFEFEFLRRAHMIFSISYSGFTIIANYLRHEPSQELFKLYPISETYV